MLNSQVKAAFKFFPLREIETSESWMVRSEPTNLQKAFKFNLNPFKVERKQHKCASVE